MNNLTNDMVNSVHGYMEFEMPFCGSFICNNSDMNEENFNHSIELVLWRCMPSNCKEVQAGVISILVFLSILITVGNIAVLIVNLSPSTRRILCRNLTMHNYSNYVISLSLADLLVGVLVLPLSINFFYDEMFASRVATASTTTLTGANMSTTLPTFFNHTLVTINDGVNESVRLEPGSRINKPVAYIDFLGFITHLSIFVSMYTLIAASIDRFYVSTKATTHSSRQFSRLSLGQFSRQHTLGCCAGNGRHSNFRLTRSAVIIFFVWVFGFFISLTPCFSILSNHYHHVGHIFVLFSFDENYGVALTWYVIILIVPFSLTWIFSILLCFVLWKRKRKLKKSSRLNQNHSTSEKKTDEKDYDSSYELTSRYSNIETPKVERVISIPTDQSSAQEECKEDCDYDDSIQVCQAKPEPVKPKISNGNRSAGNLSMLLYKRKLSVSLDFSSSELKPSLTRIVSSSKLATRQISEPNDKGFVFKNAIKSQSSEILPQNVLSKNPFLKVNGKTVSFNDSAPILNETPVPSPLIRKKQDNRTPEQTITPITTPSSTRHVACTMKNDGGRYAQRNTRRRSSIFRAKELITSNTFESNVVKSLLAMICALTVSVLPTVFVIFDLAPQYLFSNSPRNATVTSAVMSVIILLLNSFWNCVIYGGRTRYFRSSLRKKLNKAIKCRNAYKCPTFSRSSLKVKTSFFKSDSES